MTKDEAIQQAIDFLDGSYEAHAVRKALQEALAEPAQTKKALWGARDIATGILISSEDKYTEEQASKIITFIDEFLEQPAQEPIYIIGEGWQCDKLPKEATKLYTHPAPTKEWVGLSYEEADGLILQYQHAPFKFVRAIEQSLKEKNEK